ncbi:hypothetical protein GA0061093_13541 [Rhodococcus qingshengii]|nr:hypothetical protein GA0061093_13541 [Rhodococcus qingshengii]
MQIIVELPVRAHPSFFHHDHSCKIGDVKYSSAAKRARLITSVPGGSGPEALSR